MSVIHSVAITDVSVCFAASTSYPDGTVDASAGAAVAGSGDYAFTWYSGPSVDTDSLLSDGLNIVDLKNGDVQGTSMTTNIDLVTDPAILDNVVAGQYTFVVIDNETGCESASATFTVGESTTPPVAITPVTSANTVCDPANAPSAPMANNFDGSITVTSPGGRPASDFTYEWFKGQNTTMAVPAGQTNDSGNDNIMSELEGDIYTLRITDNTSNCTR